MLLKNHPSQLKQPESFKMDNRRKKKAASGTIYHATPALILRYEKNLVQNIATWRATLCQWPYVFRLIILERSRIHTVVFNFEKGIYIHERNIFKRKKPDGIMLREKMPQKILYMELRENALTPTKTPRRPPLFLPSLHPLWRLD